MYNTSLCYLYMTFKNIHKRTLFHGRIASSYVRLTTATVSTGFPSQLLCLVAIFQRWFAQTSTEMEETWNEVLRELSVPEDIAAKWWAQIVAQYTENDRIYHTYDNYLQKKFEIYNMMVKDNISEHSAFILALFFQHYQHDTNVYGDSIDKNVQHVKAFFKDAGINHVTHLFLLLWNYHETQ